MSMLKRNIAPMPSKVWDEIDERAKTVLTNILSARKVDVFMLKDLWDGIML